MQDKFLYSHKKGVPSLLKLIFLVKSMSKYASSSPVADPAVDPAPDSLRL